MRPPARGLPNFAIASCRSLFPFLPLQRHPCRRTAKWRVLWIRLDPEESRGSFIGDVARGPRETV
jgi:hypothetical protein